MANRAQIPPYNGISEAAVKELIAHKLEPLWKAVGDAMKKRAEMNLRINALEASERFEELNLSDLRNLKNQVENLKLNHARLVDEVRILSAGFIFLAIIWLFIPNQ